MIKTLQTKLNNKEVHCVNAKELKDILNIKTRLDKWIDSFIDRYSFKQGIDYKIIYLITILSYFLATKTAQHIKTA